MREWLEVVVPVKLDSAVEDDEVEDCVEDIVTKNKIERSLS